MLFEAVPADPVPLDDSWAGRTVSAQDARRSIDDLVSDARRYAASAAYRDLLRFVGRFRDYAPFNALLVHTQRSGAHYVAPAYRWREKYRRRVKPGEQPLVILQPRGPVMFVYDVSQTEPEPGAPPLPSMVTDPFAMAPMKRAEPALGRTIDNAKADGVRLTQVPAGSQAAGCIRTAVPGLTQTVQAKRRPPEFVDVPIRYEVEVNRDHTPTEQYATLAHELGHLYCGHLGTPNAKWWPDRRRTDRVLREFEAESVAYIACQRLDANARMPPFLADYLDEAPEVPDRMSLERVMTAAGRVIEMATAWCPPRKP